MSIFNRSWGEADFSSLEGWTDFYFCLEDHEVEAERLAAWSEMTVGACEIRMFPGGHFTSTVRGRSASIVPVKLNREFPPQ
jgi:surfactin synthase thioesterase subunit